MDWKKAIVEYEKTNNNVPNNNKLKFFIGNVSVKRYWLTIVDIDKSANVILIRVGKSSNSLNKSVI